MKDNKNKKRIFRKIVLSCFVFCFCFGLLTISKNEVLSQGLSVSVTDAINIKTNEKGVIENAVNWVKNFSLSKLWNETLPKLGSKAYYSALSKALNTIAYDTATWIGSGGKGQKPLFITEGWGEYMVNIGDNAAGNFIETLGREGFGGEKFNLCEPDFGVKMKIGLGLLYTERPKAPECTFSKMKENWDEALRSDDFLTDFQDMFEPESNDLGMALTLQSGIIEDKRISEKMGELERIANKGWLDVRGVNDWAKSHPGYAESQKNEAERSLTENLAQYTGDAFVDAINIFLNQLSITAFQNLMKNIGKGKDTYTHPYDWDSLTDFEAGPSNSGIAGAKNKFRELLEPKFNIRGDYNILAELTMCPDPNKAGPTNCVIEDKFRQAIENKVTVGDAIEQGHLNVNGIFGFNSDGLEPSYKDTNYPYRSMIILRKFRILPVGWEVAAQYIKDNPNKIDGIKNLGDLVACYDDSDEYEGYYSSWCKGLVDPNWVLKAPLNYCKREGYGPEIVSEQISGEGYDSKLSISRDENYCADEQSCIKENSDGSCEMYGYCTEEKRKWNFNADSCDPNYNTCQTFRNRDGKTVSYLENTLDYGICNIDNVGCQKYSISSTEYNSDTDTVNWDGTNNMYFDKDVEECDVDSEGCHEFIRTKAGLGANLIINSSFEEDLTNGDWNTLGTQNNDSYIGENSLELAGDLDYNYVINPIVFGYEVAGESFNLSFYAKDCGEAGEIQLGSAIISLSNIGNNWQYFSISNIYPLSDNSNTINFQINGANSGCKIDEIKLERGNNPTQYSDYRQNGLVYEKLLPDYLEDSCYENPGINYQFKDDMPDICNNFARKCNQNEAGCSMYTSVDNNINIPARVLAQDYCPAECDGYDNYLQQESVFDSLNPAYFIPKTAKTCGVESVGCDEFTNLDKIEEQGEQIEYYSYLRQCRNPDNQCADFYTWEGSSETGYQLRSFNLQDNGNEPTVTEDDSLECNEIIYNLPATDPAYNSDCREFYNTTGDISYHLYKRTISCSDNCHPYRRTRNNVVKNLDNSDLNATDCSNLEGNGDKQIFEGQCIFCKNGGVWNEQHQSCIYMAIPGEGIQCSASADGCREYSGNSGNNMRIILNNDFEGSTQNWEGDSLAELSNNSLMVGGESLQISGGNHLVSTTIGYLAEQNKSYYLTFIAKGDGASSFTNIGFNNGVSIEYFIENPDASMSISGNWRIYKFNLASLEHEVNDTESLFIKADGDFFIDNIRLIEITDRYYLIKDSWNTPDSCYEDIYGNPAGEIHNLGCSAYSDKDDKIHYLRQFSNLCQESAVGCELMIDTHNYNNYDSSSWNGPGDDLVEINIDNYIYAVYDQEKECNNNDQGCTRFGKVYEYENNFVYGDIYLKNNPNKYDEILCEEESVDCDEWVSDEGTNYFKNPKDQICEWRQLSGEGEKSWNWFKKKMKYCDSDSDGIVTSSVDNLCLSNNDCDLIGLTCQKSEECGVNNVCVDGQCHYSCILDNNDYDCPVSNLKTFGYGGNGNIIYQPTQDLNGYWTGICSADQSGCSEYIDPISKFNTNMIFNADFSQDVDNDLSADGWNGSSQNILLKPQTLYTVSINGDNDITISANSNVLRELNNDNLLGGLTNSINISCLVERVSKIFYVVGNDEISAIINVTDSSVGNGSSIEIKKVIIEYQKKQEVDKETCNGIVNFDDGCVLFNERVQNGLSLSKSIWDADLTFNDGTGISPNVGIESERDVNTLIKVTPDRTCNNWLACRSYIKDENDNNICFDLGLCDSFDANGNCGNFVLSKKENQTYPAPAKISNMSGYAKAGYNNSSLNSDYYPLGAMEQLGEVAQVQNGGFEFYGSNGFPIGWQVVNDSWDNNKFSVINNPISAQEEGISYPLEGKSFLKYSPSTGYIMSEFIDVEPNTEYSLSAFINTKNFFPSLEFDRLAVQVEIETYNVLGDRSISNISVDSLFDITECEDQAQPWFNGCGFNVAAGEDWEQKTKHFKVGSNTNRVKIIIRGVLYYGSSQLTEGEIMCCDKDGDEVCPEKNEDEFNFHPSARCEYEGEKTINPYSIWGCQNFNEDFSVIVERDSCAGNVYIDDIKLRPVLNKKDKQNETQTCRLYPENDSLSCEYYEDSGKKQKGWLGYCLEYDRYPGNKDACLLWYPVDKVKGEGIEEGAGYKGRMPVYYTVDANSYVINVPSYNSAGKAATDAAGVVNLFWAKQTSHGDLSGSFSYNYSKTVIPGGNYEIRNRQGRCVANGSILFETNNDDLINILVADEPHPLVPVCAGNGEATYSFELWDNDTNTMVFSWSGSVDMYLSIIFTPIIREARTIVQTVTSVGQNKYWSGRVYEGSDFEMSCNIGLPMTTIDTCNYLTDYYPFGSLVSPATTLSGLANPYEWDSKTGLDGDGNEIYPGIQPLYYEEPNLSLDEPYQARMGQLHSEDTVKRIFAQSYGSWGWNGERYVPIGGSDWGPPQNSCPNGIRPPYIEGSNADICANPPQVFNIKVNNRLSGNINLNKNGFINLTFNSKVDSQQLPLVMYAMDWGDNEKTAVSGVEMRDRSNIDNPHSVYHLYSYWDLKAKHSVDQTIESKNSVYCGNAGSVPQNYDNEVADVSCPDNSDCCAIQPSIKIKDNWGWCNNGVDNNICPTDSYDLFDGWILMNSEGTTSGACDPICISSEDVDCGESIPDNDCGDPCHGTGTRCSNGKTCVNGSCEDSCDPTCAEANTVDCGESIPDNDCGDSCHGTGTRCSNGKTCVNGSCEDSCDPTCAEANTVNCGESIPDNDCGDPCHGTGTRCSNGKTCVNGSCVSGCTPGLCKECPGPTMPDDDVNCGTIDCDGLDGYEILGEASATENNFCIYNDYSNITSDRCKDIGVCKEANTSDCPIPITNTTATCGECQFASGNSNSCGCDNYPNGTSCGVDKECNEGVCSEYKLAFVTSGAWAGGQFGGEDGADIICNNEASDAGLSGNYIAWLSSGRIIKDSLSDAIYKNTNGDIIANNLDDLTDGSLNAPINYNADGSSAGGILSVYTGISYDGTSLSNNCVNWTSNSSSKTALCGHRNSTNTGWAGAGSCECDVPHNSTGLHLYCFEL